MKYIGLILIALFLNFGQEQEKKIQWSQDIPLTWEHFKGEPDHSLPYSANTNSGISYSWNYSTASGQPVLEYEVFSNFYPNRSWVKELEEEEYLLGHEQLHFDISELHARKLRRALDEYEVGRNLREDLKKIYSGIESQRSAMQKQFDKETRHSENREAEMKWRKFIAAELERLKAYSI